MSTIRDVMIKKVHTVQENDDVKKVCRILTKHKISGTPVINAKGKLVGFVSERDIIAAVPRAGFLENTAGRLMTRKVATVCPDDPITHASKIFSQRNFRLLPVIKAGKIVGMVARKGLIEHILGDYY